VLVLFDTWTGLCPRSMPVPTARVPKRFLDTHYEIQVEVPELGTHEEGHEPPRAIKTPKGR
jgi:hypothetical protein